MSRFRFLASLILLPAAAFAQQTGPAAEPATTLHVTARLVYVDVVARDAHGNVMKGLTQQDFKVLEDGRPVSVEFFTAHTPASAAPTATAESRPGTSKTEFTNVTSGGNTKPVTIVLCDLLNTPNDDQLTARQQMLKFLDALPSGDRIMIFTLANGLQMTQGLTGSASLRSDVSKMLRPRDVGLDDSKTESMMDAQIATNFAAQFSGNPLATSGGAMGAGLKIAESQNYDVRARTTISALGGLARAMAGYPGRKSLYWLAESFPLSVDVVGVPVNHEGAAAAKYAADESVSRSTSSLTDQQGHFSQTSYLEMRATLNQLASARIAVYPTSVFGLATQSSSVVVTAGASPANNPGDPRGGFFTLGNLKSEMQDLARETGGEAIFGTNDIAGAMERTRDDSASYYTLVYKPTNDEWNGRFRKIHVEAAGSGSLIYRRGYFATPDGAVTDSGDDLRRAMRPGVPEETSLRLRSKLLPSDPQHPGLLVESTITTEDISFTTTPDGHRRARLFVQMVAFNDGKPQPKSLPQTAGALNIDLDPQRYEFIRSAGIAFRQQLALKPGKYRVVLGVSDESSRKLGTVEMPVVVPASE
jgi:VWFA-related protein